MMYIKLQSEIFYFLTTISALISDEVSYTIYQIFKFEFEDLRKYIIYSSIVDLKNSGLAMVLTKEAMSKLSRQELENYVIVQDAHFSSLLHGIQKELTTIQGDIETKKDVYRKMKLENAKIKLKNRELKRKMGNIGNIVEK